MSRFIRSFRRPAVLAGAVLFAAGALVPADPSFAEAACLKGGAANKLCVDLTSIPGDAVQPSGLAGTPTYVKYTAVLSDTTATSRNIMLSLDLSPASGFVSIEAEPGLSCGISGSTVTCYADKLEVVNPLTLVAVAEAPRHPTAVTQLVNTATIGWNGNTAGTQKAVAVSDTSGRTYVPAGTQVTLVTGPESADPAQQTSPEQPLFGKVTLPPQPQDYYARIAVVSDGPAISNCTAGVFTSGVDGGPYLCRTEPAGGPHRWVEFDVGTTPGANPPVLFGTANPMQVTLVWDASMISSAQLPPTALAPTGTPSFAVFYAQTERTPPPATVVARAFARSCSSSAPPCLTSVQRFGTGDWTASGLKPTDESDWLAASPLAPLYAALDFLIGEAGAGGIKPPILQ
jgi:hypothetical protein